MAENRAFSYNVLMWYPHSPSSAMLLLLVLIIVGAGLAPACVPGGIARVPGDHRVQQ